MQFTYISLDDYRIIREDLFGNGGRNLNDREPVSYSVFIDPPLSRIGLSEEEAVRKGLNIVAMAMKTDQPYTFLRDFVFTHPSMSEALNDLMNF